MYRVEKWKQSRFWAVLGPEGLVCLCVYKKGAREIIRRLSSGG